MYAILNDNIVNKLERLLDVSSRSFQVVETHSRKRGEKCLQQLLQFMFFIWSNVVALPSQLTCVNQLELATIAILWPFFCDNMGELVSNTYDQTS